MLTPALRVENRIHRPHGPHLCEHRPLSRKPAVPRPPECTDPQRWRPSRRQPRHERGVLRARLLRPAGRHAMVVAHFFESGKRRRLRWGRVEKRTANGRRSSAGQHRVHSLRSTKRAWAGPRRLGPGVQGSPQREPALPTETAREQSTRGARSSHPFGAGAGSQPSCGRRGQAVVRRTVP